MWCVGANPSRDTVTPHTLMQLRAAVATGMGGAAFLLVPATLGSDAGEGAGPLPVQHVTSSSGQQLTSAAAGEQLTSAAAAGQQEAASLSYALHGSNVAAVPPASAAFAPEGEGGLFATMLRESTSPSWGAPLRGTCDWGMDGAPGIQSAGASSSSATCDVVSASVLSSPSCSAFSADYGMDRVGQRGMMSIGPHQHPSSKEGAACADGVGPLGPLPRHSFVAPSSVAYAEVHQSLPAPISRAYAQRPVAPSAAPLSSVLSPLGTTPRAMTMQSIAPVGGSGTAGVGASDTYGEGYGSILVRRSEREWGL